MSKPVGTEARHIGVILSVSDPRRALSGPRTSA